MTEFRLLGPLEATVGGRPLALPPGKPSAVLARLLLDTGRVVPLETLIAGLWAEAPASARKMIQACDPTRNGMTAVGAATRPANAA